MSDLLDAVRERVGVDTLVTAAVLVGLWTVVLDAGPVEVAASLAATALVVVPDAYDIGAARHIGLGFAAVLGAGVLAAVGDGAPWVPVGLGVVGVWLSADAVQTLRRAPDPGPGAAADGREVYHQYVAGRIQELLDEGSRPRLGVAAELDADREAVDPALALLVERGGGDYRRSTPTVAASSAGGAADSAEWRAGSPGRSPSSSLPGTTRGPGRRSHPPADSGLGSATAAPTATTSRRLTSLTTGAIGRGVAAAARAPRRRGGAAPARRGP